LFGKHDRHVTAEGLFDEARKSEAKISLATVYNTLRQFQLVGLLQEITLGSGKVYYDTNTSIHYHFLVEDTNDLIDIPESNIVVECMQKLPLGVEILRVDVVIRMRVGNCFGCDRLTDCLTRGTQENEFCDQKF
jgi:Fur family iron response transcriptional regulator